MKSDGQIRTVVPIFFIIWLLLTCAAACGVEIVTGRLKISTGSDNYIPYISNYPLDVTNSKIRHVILAIHSSNYDAGMVYDKVLALLEKYSLTDSVLVIAPQFLIRDHISNVRSQGLVYWQVYPFWGSSMAKVTPDGKDFRISAYTILENIISEVCEKTDFTNLESIVILGHSAGSQLVNRFAASNTVEDEVARPAAIKITYVVMNPSSYVYLSPKRSVRGSRKRFAVPDEKVIAKNPEYNNYGYGLDNLYAYHRSKGLTAEKIREQYQRRRVIYVMGREDTETETDKSMSKHPSAMLQGKNRLQRGRIYYGHLIDEFGQDIENKHKFVHIRDVGHSGEKIILSPMGAKHIIGDFVEHRRSQVGKDENR
jgi:hypothetical protein